MKNSPEHKTILNIYAALTVSLLMSFLPMMSAAFLALAMFLGVWIAAYVIRSKSEHDSLSFDHMTFVIRTIWISGLFAVITTSIAGMYVISVVDSTAVMACASSVSTSLDMKAMEAAVQPCMDQFLQDNMSEFIKGTLIAAGPLVVYLGYRLSKGLSRALKGHRIGDVKNWF